MLIKRLTHPLVVSDGYGVVDLAALFDALLKGQVVRVRYPADVVRVLHPFPAEVCRGPAVDRVPCNHSLSYDVTKVSRKLCTNRRIASWTPRWPEPTAAQKSSGDSAGRSSRRRSPTAPKSALSEYGQSS